MAMTWDDEIFWKNWRGRNFSAPGGEKNSESRIVKSERGELAANGREGRLIFKEWARDNEPENHSRALRTLPTVSAASYQL
jgi:hypothetical protein